MKSKLFKLVFVIAVVMLMLSPERESLAQEDTPQVEPSGGEVTAVITPVIGFQGRLVEGGSPVTGNRVMTFKLFSSLGATSPIWLETKTVSVTNGLFQTALGDTEPFEGYMNQIAHEMWLEISVGGTVLPRQQLMGAPYAFTLAPGAWVIDNSSFSSAYFQNLGSGNGIAGYAASDGSGIEGVSSAGVGVSGRSTSGHGVETFSEGTGFNGTSLYARAYNAGGIAAWVHNDSSVSTDAALIISNDGSGALLKGYGGNGGEHEVAILNDGTIKQALVADGLVKAGVSFYCGSTGSNIWDSFNNVNTATITVSNSASPVGCFVDLNFNLSDRYWVAMMNGVGNVTSKCYITATTDTLFCHSWTVAGTAVNDPIMLVIY